MREWLYTLLSTDPQLGSTFGNRFLQGESATSVNIIKPFLVYTIGNSTSELFSEDEDSDPERQFFQIYIHDEGGDYTQIDNAITRVKQLLHNASDPASGVQTVIFLETSRDLDDTTMGTILRYIRFQAIKTRST